MAELVEDLRRIVESERERFAVPGCAVVVVRDGEVVLCEGFGRRDLGRDLPVTARTSFPIASSTKTFTAALCAVLVDEGLLEWHRPVRDYLPDLRLRDPVAAEQVSVYDLLCHRSGLPRHDLLWYAAAGAGVSRAELVAQLRHLAPSRPVRASWQYNNLLYTAVGELVGALTGGTYEQAVTDRLLRPLGMMRTTYSLDQATADPDAARPYAAESIETPVEEVGYARLELVAAAGGLNSCAEDLAPWLLTLLGHGVGSQPPRLSDSVRSLLRTPAMPLPEESLLTVNPAVGYGLGTLIEDYRGYRIVHHGGNIDGFASQVSTIPEAGCGIAVLTNRDGSSLRDALPLLVYDRLLDLPGRPHGPDLLARQVALQQGRAQAHERIVTAHLDLPPVRPLADYAGRYHDPGYGDLVVSEAEGQLSAQYRSLSGRLAHRHLEVFTLLVDLAGVETPIPVQFHHDLDGEVCAASCRLEPAVEPVRFARVPDTDHLTDELLDRLAGTYRMGPLTATVTRRGRRGLVAQLGEGGFRELTPVRGLVFRAGQDRVEFTTDGWLVGPLGHFRRQPDTLDGPSDQPHRTHG